MKVLASDFEIPSSPAGSRFGTVGSIISGLWDYVIPLAGVIMLVMIVWGGLEMMLSGGGEGFSRGKNRVVLGIAGFVVVFLSWFLIRALEIIFEIPILG